MPCGLVTVPRHGAVKTIGGANSRRDYKNPYRRKGSLTLPDVVPGFVVLMQFIAV